MKVMGREVWIFNQFAVSPDMAGGTRHYDLAREMVKKGWRVRIFASDFQVGKGFIKLKKWQLYRKQYINGVEFIWIRALPYRVSNWRRVANWASFAANAFLIASFFRKPDVIMGSIPQLFPAYSAYLTAKVKGSKFLLEVRDLYIPALKDLGVVSENSLQAKFWNSLERKLCKQANFVITLAKGVSDYLKKWGIPSSKILYLPNGVYPDDFLINADRTELRRRFGLTHFTAVYTGAHGIANALETILKAGKLLKEKNIAGIKIILVGEGTLKPHLINWAKRERLDNIAFLEPLPKKEIPFFLKAADVGILTLRNIPSFTYAVSPNKLFDYMAAGLPVICAVAGECAEIITESGGGIAVPPEDPEALVNALLYFYNLPLKERERMGQLGRQYVITNHSRPKLAEKLMKAIEFVIKAG
jgi:glycosyltransferase involved in cell wall biosynthesis